MRRIVIGVLMFAVAGCSSERAISAPQPQKSALLQCRVSDGEANGGCGPMPLLLIDGERASWEGSPDLNPSEIEAVEVLKGKAALQLYGVDGRNGVIRITTRKLKL